MDIYNALGRARTLFVGRFLDDEACNQLIASLVWLNGQSATDPITLYFNVPGALGKPAWAVFDTMKRMKCPIVTINTGTCFATSCFCAPILQLPLLLRLTPPLTMRHAMCRSHRGYGRPPVLRRQQRHALRHPQQPLLDEQVRPGRRPSGGRAHSRPSLPTIYIHVHYCPPMYITPHAYGSRPVSGTGPTFYFPQPAAVPVTLTLTPYTAHHTPHTAHRTPHTTHHTPHTTHHTPPICCTVLLPCLTRLTGPSRRPGAGRKGGSAREREDDCGNEHVDGPAPGEAAQ